jgi:hypothetical protein
MGCVAGIGTAGHGAARHDCESTFRIDIVIPAIRWAESTGKNWCPLKKMPA